MRSGPAVLGFLFFLTATGSLFTQARTFEMASPKSQSNPQIAELHASFAHPPDDCRIMVRWWWFGPSATEPELQRELEQMKAAGIGGVEIATLYPLALDDPASGLHNYLFVSDEHIDRLRFVAQEARRLGLRVDVTLGSGWPFGGPHIPVSEAAGQLRVESLAIPSGAASVAVPAIESGERIIAVFLVPGAGAQLNLKEAVSLPLPSGSRLAPTDTSTSDRTVFFFIASRTGMMVKRAARGAAGFVLDHYDAAAIENHLHAVGDRLLSAFGDHPPYAVFSDSLEDYGSDWTPDLLAEFQRRRGYDLTPLLPALIGDIGPDTPGIRHDWGLTLTEVANERFLQPVQSWAHQHHTLFRSQTYGFPPVTLSSNRFADLPEGEGKASIDMARQFSDTRWAASAGHLFHHNVVSSETWTWLHSPAFRATPLDMKAEADLHFLQGINQLVGHGWPYSPESAGEPGWRMYAAGAFNAHNPWFFAMPDLASYLQRVSYALRLGEPVTDVAVLLPNDDVWASFKARIHQDKPATSLGGFDETGSNVTIDESMPHVLGAELLPQILDAGFNFDFIDADAIDTVGIPYKALVLPGVERIPPDEYEKILDFARRGGIVVATRREPSTAPGHRDAAAVSAHIEALSKELFHGNLASARFIPDERTLGSSLRSWLHPDLDINPRTPDLGFIHRHLPTGDLYFVANTSSRFVSVDAAFRSGSARAELWGPFAGNVIGLDSRERIRLDLQPYESRLIFFSTGQLAPVLFRPDKASRRIDISHNWQVSFQSPQKSFAMENLSSWSDDPNLRYYSGVATYQKTIEMADDDLRSAHSVLLDFGEGNSVPHPDPLPQFNMRAYLDSPIREAGQVFINDQPAGFVWHPPFRLEIAPLLHPGRNEIRVVVGNTAINELAGQAPPTYRLQRDLYGVEFIPQDIQGLVPLPSGLRGPITLIIGDTGPGN
jgi:hypothetical protein